MREPLKSVTADETSRMIQALHQCPVPPQALVWDHRLRWRGDLERLGELATRTGWVTTHGEPGPHNQLVTPHGRRLVDWESMRVAPRERDLTDLARSGRWRGGRSEPEPAMLELFDLHRRLEEIGEYAERFRAPHTGAEDDQVALGGLVEQLERPDWLAGR